MLSLSERQIIAKNALQTQYPWLVLCELQLNDAADTYHRWVQNYEDVVLMLDTYGGSNVVAHYKLNDNDWSTQVLDASGNAHHGTAQRNTVHLHRAGLIDGAHQQNGSSDYTDCGDPFQSTFQSSFSVSCWVKPDDGITGSNDLFIGSADTTGDVSIVHIGITGTGEAFFTYQSEGVPGAAAVTNDVIFVDGPAPNWVHIVAVADSTVNGVGGKKIYINGVEEALDVTSNGSTLNVVFSAFTTVQNVFMGAYNSNGVAANYFAGGIDNVMIFNKALAPAEVTALYNSGSGTERVPAVFTGFNFDIDAINYRGGEVPTSVLRLSNVTQFIKDDIEANRGCTQSQIVLRVVHADSLYEDYSELELFFDIIAPRITSKFVEFKLGGPSPLRRRVPLDRYYADSCRYVGEFKGPRCGYAGAETACSGLRSRCRELSNEARFGGFPGLRPETLQLA